MLPDFTGHITTDTNPHGTHYIDGKPVPSVTQVLPKPDLTRAAAVVTAREAVTHIAGLVEHLLGDRYSRRQITDQLAGHYRELWDAKAQLGTDVHHWALEQCWQDPKAANRAPWHLRQHLEHWCRWVAEHEAAPAMVETAVYSRTHRYAGTPDALAVIDGQTWLIDVKTGRRVPETVPLQLAAYQHAEFYLEAGVECPTVRAERFGVIHLTADGCTLHPVEVGQAEWDAYLGALTLNRWQTEVAAQ